MPAESSTQTAASSCHSDRDNLTVSSIPEHIIFGRSSAMQYVRQAVEGVAGESVPVLLLGERGTGKEVIAREIHRRSPWRSTPFVKLSSVDSITALPTNTRQDDNAVLPWANTQSTGSACTLFIEEVSQLSLSLQARLLEFFYDGSLNHSSRELADPQRARIICTSTRNLENEIASGNFRLDLFYRINVVAIRLPALRSRKEDIPDLAEYFVESTCRQQNRSCQRLTLHLLQLFSQHDWPGNIRELENFVRTYVNSDGNMELAEALLSKKTKTAAHNQISERREHRIPLKAYTRQLVEQAERDLILRVLRQQQWNRKETAKVLQVSYQTLLHKLKQTGLDRKCRTRPGAADQVQE